MIHPARLQPLNAVPTPQHGQFVLLWVQATARVTDNHALAYALHRAAMHGLPLVAVFGLTPSYPEANARHYHFLVEGLRDLRAGLQALGVPLHIGLGSPPDVALRAAARGAALVVTDVGYLRLQRQWRAQVGQALEGLGVPLIAVESEAVVPVLTVSDKQEYAARTIRPKLRRLLPDFLHPVEPPAPRPPDGEWTLSSWPEGERLAPGFVEGLPIDQSVTRGRETGGERAALERLAAFVARDLPGYAEGRNDPARDAGSRLSAHLHYGHLSPITAARAALASDAPAAAIDAFLEELIIRRELSFNYCWFQPDYDRYAGLPAWARATLDAHATDPRPHLYTPDELERAATHDPAWNAAQREMVATGRMQHYMRRYWGKKILEWSPSPQDAHRVALALNNRYEQDGRDANSFVGVSWVFGLHDRPWTRRPVFGTVRSMTASGLQRKFDIAAYIRRWRDPGA